MTRRAAATEAELKRMINAASGCGLRVAEIIMTSDAIRIVLDHGKASPPPPEPEDPQPKKWA